MHTQAFCHPLLLSQRPVDSSDDGKRQRERQKCNADFARASRFFVHFFTVTARLLVHHLGPENWSLILISGE